MSNGFLSPISISGPFVDRIDFDANRNRPESDTLNASITITTPDNLQLSHENGKFTLPFSMQINFILTEEIEGSEETRLSVLASAVGSLSVADAIGIPEHEVFEALKLNGVSMFYSFLRSQVEIMTGQSLLGRFTIQPIDPAAYLEGLKQQVNQV